MLYVSTFVPLVETRSHSTHPTHASGQATDASVSLSTAVNDASLRAAVRRQKDIQAGIAGAISGLLIGAALTLVAEG